MPTQSVGQLISLHSDLLQWVSIWLFISERVKTALTYPSPRMFPHQGCECFLHVLRMSVLPRGKIVALEGGGVLDSFVHSANYQQMPAKSSGTVPGTGYHLVQPPHFTDVGNCVQSSLAGASCIFSTFTEGLLCTNHCAWCWRAKVIPSSGGEK